MFCDRNLDKSTIFVLHIWHLMSSALRGGKILHFFQFQLRLHSNYFSKQYWKTKVVIKMSN